MIMPLHLVLYEPEIPPNTGNIIRLCANSGAQLHLIEPFGFELSAKQCRRAGLDYHDLTHVRRYADYATFCRSHPRARLFSCSTKARTSYVEPNYRDGDMFLLGPETRGLPEHILQATAESQLIQIPMLPSSRSMNLANAAAIVLYEAWRQLDFADLRCSVV